MLRWKSRADLSNKVIKVLFAENRKERLHGSFSKTQKLVVPESGWKSGFIAFLLPDGRDFGVDRC
jgi:hypothetical protein